MDDPRGKKLPNKEYQLTYLCEDVTKRKKSYGEAIDAVIKRAKDWSSARRTLEDDWEECWANYFSNWRGNCVIQRKTAITVGDVNNDYRHRIPTSKAFELVETVNSYLQDAFFPTRNWFDLKPKKPMGDTWIEDTKVLNQFVLNKLEEANFTDYWDCFIRQACVIGTSVLALPWTVVTKDSFKNIIEANGNIKPVPYTKVETNGLDLEVVDMYDFYIDPKAKEPRKGDVIRRIVKTKGEVIRLIESDTFPLGDVKQVYKTPGYHNRGSTESSQKVDTMEYMNGIDEFNDDTEIELFEYWGNLVICDTEFLDVHVICTEDNLMVFEPNPYWGGKPFIIGTLINGHGTPYGKGLLEPILGNLHKLFIGGNQRLDANEITVNPMWLAKNDGSINPGDIYSEPGRVILVEDTETDLTPVPMQVANLQNVLQDEGIIEDRINRASGVGDYVGVNAGRDAERVTAREVEARQNAGGNRLGRYHKHIEQTSLREFLVKMYEYLKQFIIEDEVVRLESPQRAVQNDYQFFKVGQEELQHDVDIVPIGADHVVDKEFELRQHIDFYTFVQGNPQLAQFINWVEVAKDLARRLIKDDWTKFVMLPEEQGSMGADAATGKSPMELMGMLGGGQGMPPQPPPMMPEQMMMEQQMSEQPQASADQAQLEQMLANNPELLKKILSENAVQNEKMKGNI